MAKWFISASSTVVLTTLSIVQLAASRIASMFLNTCSACSSIVSAILPVAGSIGICPDM